MKNPKSSYQIVEKEDYDIKIECRTLTGKRIHFKVSSVSYVSDIENKIFNMIGILPDQQRLIYGSKQLDKGDLCGNIFDQSDKEYKVNLISRLRGGMMHPSSGKGDNHNMTSVDIMISENLKIRLNFTESVSREEVEEKINEYLSSLEGIVDTFKSIESDESSRYKHVLMTEDILRKDERF